MHRAPWIMTGLSGSNMAGQCVVADGALVVADGRIKAIGPYREIVKYYGGCQLCDHENLILAPPLINSHCHLELSYLDLAGKAGGSSRYEGDTPAWIAETFCGKRPDFILTLQMLRRSRVQGQGSTCSTCMLKVLHL